MSAEHARLSHLVLVLERMSALYERVDELIHRERLALVQLDYDTLFSLMAEKDEVQAAIRALDRDRLICQDRIAKAVGLVVESSLGELLMGCRAHGIGALLQSGQRKSDLDQLAAIYPKLKTQIHELKNKIDSNSEFVERSISHLHAIAENLSRAIQGREEKKTPSTYTGKARMQKDSPRSGAIMEKRS